MNPSQPSTGDSASKTSRRKFLAASSTAVVTSSLIAGMAVPRMAHAAGNEKIRIGLVGCGGRGTGAANQALKTEGDVQLVAMGDAFADRLESSHQNLVAELEKEGKADRIDVPPDRRFVGFDAYEKVINAGIDLVILATPPGFRPMHFMKAVLAGKHVFMEKPVAVDAPGVRVVAQVGQLAKNKKLAVGVGLQRRHQKAYIETIKRLQDGAIGDIITARAYWNSAGVWVRPRTEGQTDMEYQMRNWYYFNWLCGDHIVEQHIHNLDVINWLKNAYPVRAQGMGGRQVRVEEKYGEIFDHHAVEFEYADGTRMFSYCRHIPNCWDSMSEHVHGSKGKADISSATVETIGSETWKYRGPLNNPYQTEHDDLFASIRAGDPINEADYGAYSTMTAIMGRMATYSGKMIEWDTAINSELSLMPKELAWNAPPPAPSVAIPGVTKVV